jgi:hypothetical protein
MPNPLSYVPYAIAAAGGSVNGHSARALIAAGITLLQRCPPLVRALATSSPASLLLPSAAFVTALGASDGHALLVLDPREVMFRVKETLAAAGTRVVFTEAAFAAQVPIETICVLLERVPQFATVRLSATDIRSVDLGSHFGLELEGESGAEGSEETVLRWYENGELRHASHRDVMSGESGGWAGELIRHLSVTPRRDEPSSENG